MGPWATRLLCGDSPPAPACSIPWVAASAGCQALGALPAPAPSPPLAPAAAWRGLPREPPPAQLRLISLLPCWGISCGIHLPVFLTPRMLLAAMGARRHLPSPSAAQNSSVQTSALVFNGLFLLPGGESPSPALYRSLAALCQACWHLYLPPHPVNGGVYGCTSTYRVCGWLTGKQHLLLPGIASLPAVTVTLLVGGQIWPPAMWSRQWGAPGCARLWDAGDDALLSLD